MNFGLLWVLLCALAGAWLFWHDRNTKYIGHGVIKLQDRLQAWSTRDRPVCNAVWCQRPGFHAPHEAGDPDDIPIEPFVLAGVDILDDRLCAVPGCWKPADHPVHQRRLRDIGSERHAFADFWRDIHG